MSARYRQLRDMLERICRLYMKDESLQMTDLAARISFLSSCVSLDSAEQNKLTHVQAYIQCHTQP
jgi:hypothetical protein